MRMISRNTNATSEKHEKLYRYVAKILRKNGPQKWTAYTSQMVPAFVAAKSVAVSEKASSNEVDAPCRWSHSQTSVSAYQPKKKHIGRESGKLEMGVPAAVIHKATRWRFFFFFFLFFFFL